jgi:lipoate-protein ligase A
LIYLGVETTAPDITSNLAIDEALLDYCEAVGPARAIRFWELPTYAVVLGASCRVDDDVDVGYCHTQGIALARRSSGGGTVLIGPGALNVAVVLPVDEAPGLGAVDVAQRYVMQKLAVALHALVSAIDIQGSGDLTLGRRKCAGSAQRRLRKHFMVHASVLCGLDLARVERCLRIPKRQPTYREGRSHVAFLANLPTTTAAVIDALKAAWGIAGMLPSTGMDVADIQHRVETKFSRPEWTMRF